MGPDASPRRSHDSSPGDSEPAWMERSRLAWRIDLAPSGRPPSNVRWALATIVSLVGSLGFDALTIEIATSQLPATRGFSHFHFSDYATLTVIGVLVACVAWPLVTRVSSSARWLFFRLAVIVTLVLWLPDLWLFLQGENTEAVGALMVMHLLVALVTYNALVHLAPVGRAADGPAARRSAPGPLRLSDRAVRRVWSAMAVLVALELALGVAVIVSVPFRRPNAILPTRSIWIYAAHGAVGIALGLGAVAVLVLATVSSRIGRIGAVMGAIGVGVGLAGGVLATFQETRLLGMGVMLLGVVVAGVGYMAPFLEALGKAEAARAEAARAEAARAAAGRAQAQRAAAAASGAPTPDGVSTNGHGAEPPVA